jgi:hypothetical protein
VGKHGFKQRKCRSRVITEEEFGLDHGLAGFNEGGEVEDTIEGASRIVSGDEEIFEGEPVSEFALNKLDSYREQIAPAVAQVVKNEGLMSLFGKKSRNGCTNVPSTTSNQYPHKKDCPFVNTLCTLEVYYNRVWPEGQVAFGRELPGTWLAPQNVLQFFVLAGSAVLPARCFETRVADRLLKGKEVRVLLDALDKNWRFWMSKADTPRRSNSVARCDFILRNHCTPPSERFVSRKVMHRIVWSFGSTDWNRKPGQVAGACVSGVIGRTSQCDKTRDELHLSAYGEHETGPGSDQIAIGQNLNRAVAGMTKAGGGMHMGIRSALVGHAFPATPTFCRPEGRERGLRLWR